MQPKRSRRIVFEKSLEIEGHSRDTLHNPRTPILRTRFVGRKREEDTNRSRREDVSPSYLTKCSCDMKWWCFDGNDWRVSPLEVVPWREKVQCLRRTDTNEYSTHWDMTRAELYLLVFDSVGYDGFSNKRFSNTRTQMSSCLDVFTQIREQLPTLILNDVEMTVLDMFPFESSAATLRNVLLLHECRSSCSIIERIKYCT